MESSDAERGVVQPLRSSDAELEQQLWLRFRAATSPEAFYGAWLALQCRQIEDVRAGLVLAALRPGGGLEPVASHPEGSPHRRHLLTAAERVVKERRALALQLEPRASAEGAAARTVIARPVESGDALLAVVALEVAPRSNAELERALRTLAWGSSWLLVYEGQGPEAGGRSGQLLELLQLISPAFEHTRFRSSATAFATALAAHFGCERASLGFVEGSRVRLAAVSHSSSFDRRANLTRALEAAMDEAVDQEGEVSWPQAAEGDARASRAQEDLARQSTAAWVATWPLVHGDRFVGAATLERMGGEPLAASERELLAAALGFAGPHLDVQHREDRWLAAKAVDALRGQLGTLLGPHHVVAKLVALACVGVLLFLVFARGDYRVSADTVLEASVLRAATAPFAGYIAEAPVRAGEVVQQGDLLARLDDRDLVLERARNSSQLQQLRKQQRQALAERDAAQAEILGAQIEQVSAQLGLVVDRLGRTRIEAPFDGIVASGDLSQELGAPVERGDLLFEIAPLEDYRVVLMVEERDVDEIAPGQRGQVAFFAVPERRFGVEVEQVTPVSEPGEGTNRFRVEAQLTEPPAAEMRPGMEGVTKVFVERRRLIWIWTHEALDWLRLKLWQWLP